RRTEGEFWCAFDEARAQLFGALCSAGAAALRHRASVRLVALPRMADFAVWVTAAEPALCWPRGDFLEAYGGNRADAHDLPLDASPVAGEIRALLAEQLSWAGTAGDLLQALNARAATGLVRQRTWPTTPRALGSILRRLAPNLRAISIAIEFGREPGTARRRLITLKNEALTTVPIVPSVPGLFGQGPETHDSRMIGRDGPDGQDDKSRDWLERNPTRNDGERRPNGTLEPSETFTFWPEQIAGLGRHQTGTYSGCARCGAGTWVQYGYHALCLPCA